MQALQKARPLAHKTTYLARVSAAQALNKSITVQANPTKNSLIPSNQQSTAIIPLADNLKITDRHCLAQHTTSTQHTWCFIYS